VWPGKAAVYMRMQHTDGTWCAWEAMDYECAQCALHITQIVCATEAGPLPDDWKPEEVPF
jgi:hypothetical protein